MRCSTGVEAIVIIDPGLVIGIGTFDEMGAFQKLIDYR